MCLAMFAATNVSLIHMPCLVIKITFFEARLPTLYTINSHRYLKKNTGQTFEDDIINSELP